MECVMPEQDLLVHTLHDTNDRLRFRLEGLRQGRPVPVSPECIAGLLSELLFAAEELHDRLSPDEQQSPQLKRELAAYRENVEQLREMLPGILRQLLTERARLEAECFRVQVAAEWARSSLQTL